MANRNKKYLRYSMFVFFVFLLSYNLLQAQELNARVVVNAQQLGTSTDQSAIRSMQTQITEFLNNKKWTKDVFLPQERISCNFSITLKSAANQNTYDATLIVQAARPVFHSVYQSPLVNYRDDMFTFKYMPSQRIDFDATRVSAGDPLSANLTAVLAYWVHIILGMHYSSFELKAGEPYFRTAQNIVNAAPQNNSLKGWQTFDGDRSRFVLSNNLSNPRYEKMYEVFYTFYRKGLDNIYDEPNTAVDNVLNALRSLHQLYLNNPSSMLIPFFIENRGQELSGIFKKSAPALRTEAYQILTLLDPGNIETYNELQK